MMVVGTMLVLLAGFLVLAHPAVASLPEPGARTIGVGPQQAGGDYDADNDGLIEIRNLAQLDAMRYDLDGNGASNDAAYAAAFPGAATNMGCPSSGCAGYELVANLDFDTNRNGRADAGDAYWNGGDGWLPIGTYRVSYSASGSFQSQFDGGGHTISNLYISRTGAHFVGLFGALRGSGGHVRQLGLVAVNVTGFTNVGGLVGYMDRSSTVTHSYVTGDVIGVEDVGGLVGDSRAAITDSHASSTVSGNFRVGGLTGAHNGGIIARSHASGEVNASLRHAGGLAGYNSSTINGSYATGDVFAVEDGTGGLIGYNSGIINGSYATGTVTGSGWNVGGLVGENRSGTVNGSYSTASVTGVHGYVGGLVGWHHHRGKINSSYATGSVTGNIASGGIGGLVGSNVRYRSYNPAPGPVTLSYWNTQTTGQPTSAGSDDSAGKTTSQLQAPIRNTGIYAGWSASWWDFGTSSQYPVLKYSGLSVSLQRGGSAETPTPAPVPTPQPGGLGNPVNLRAAAAGSGQVSLTWQPASNADTHWIYSVGFDGSDEQWTQAAGSAGSATVSNLGGGQFYWFTVIAQRSTTGQPQWSQWSNWAEASVAGASQQPGALGNPTNLRVVGVGDGQVTLGWRPASNADAHWIGWYRIASDGSETLEDTLKVSGTASSATITGLENGQLYSFGVFATRDATGGAQWSQESNRVQAMPVSTTQPGALGNPTNLRVASMGAGQVTLEWQPASNADAHWIGWYRVASDGSETLEDTLKVSGTASSATVTGLENGQLYSFVVFASRSVAGEFQSSQESNRAQATVGPAQASAATDRAALVALYNATGGANWTNDDGWLGDAPVGQWHGVTTDDNGRVSELRLPSNGLTGALPTELGNLSNLVWLDLDYNRLSGSIPATVGNLSGLTVLRLGSNELTGEIPAELGGLADLTILGLGNNQLTGPIPSQLGNLAGLTRLSLWNNQLTGELPAELGNLTQLTRLVLGRNHLTWPIPASLGNLTSLEALNLSNNDLTGAIPAELGNLTGLESLNFDNNSLTGPIPAAVGNLTNLVVLRLGGNQLNGQVPPALGSLSSLSILGLGNNQLSGPIPYQMGNLSSLTLMSLYNNQLTGPVPSQLGSLSNLIRLSLGSNRLSGPIPSQLGNLAQLQHLYLQENQLTGSIPSQLGSLSNLNNLDLSGNHLNGEIPPSLGSLTSLKSLRLSKNQLTGTMPPTLGSLSSLTRLYLYENRLTGTIPTELGRLTNLEVLNLSHNQLSGEIPAGIFTANVAVHSSRENNRAMPAELVLPTNVAYLEPGLRLDGTMPSQPTFLSSLRVLNLSNNQFSGVVPAALSQHPTLQRTYLANSNLSSASCSAYGGTRKLTEAGTCAYCTADVEARGIENDREALAHLYKLTDGRGVVPNPFSRGSKWTNHDGWEEHFQDGNPPLDEWYGVITNDAGRVIGLNLHDNNLQGRTTVSDWARHITIMNARSGVLGCAYPLYWLEELDFGDNKLDGDIGALLSDIRLQPGVTLEVDLTGDENNWTPASIVDESLRVSDPGRRVAYKDVKEVTVPDNLQLADDLEERIGSEAGIELVLYQTCTGISRMQ
ncbi:MAG: fibronectin type III domain-containing protein [Gemmatimonadota bacterium]|nr:fibronectin type III domain-containing protein [Gemmatimonadota bacterium]